MLRLDIYAVHAVNTTLCTFYSTPQKDTLQNTVNFSMPM